MNRGNRQNQQQPPTPEGNLGGIPKPPAPKPSKTKKSLKLAKAGWITFLIAIAILIAAVLLSIVFSKDNTYKEGSYVKTDKLQAVFLNGGQVYFGKISDLNSKYLTLDKIYYLRVNQQVQPDQQNQTPNANDISLVKLGCELHGPEDSMVINREQVIFWENLKTDGQVAQAVESYIKANPDGQKCNNNNQQNSNNSNTNTNTNTNANNSNLNTNNQNNNAANTNTNNADNN